MGETIKIDMAQAMDLLNLAVEEKGYSHVDPHAGFGGCRNVDLDDDRNLAPSCIVGHALFYAGVSLDMLAKHSGGVRSTVIGITNEENVDLEVTTAALVLFHTAQREQDNGREWGEAVDTARFIAQLFEEGGVR